MKRYIVSSLVMGSLCLLGARAIPAEDSTPTIETQLRERLRDTMLQLRAAETDRAALQAAQTQSADENKALTERLQAVTKQADANKQAAQTAAQTVETLKSQVSRQDKEIADLRESIESTRRAAELARNKAADRARLADDAVIQLERLVADRQTKNVALYNIASEILQRYEKFGLGDALMAREPFVGITRVKLRNLVQDYQDKLLDQRVTLHEKDLPAYRHEVSSQPAQTAGTTTGVSNQTSE
jgi:hypothetical protein